MGQSQQQGSGQSSITLSTNSKGQIQPDVKLYLPPSPVDQDSDDAMDDALDLARHTVTVLCKVADELAIAGAPMVWDVETVSRMRNLYCARVLKLGEKAEAKSA